MLVGVVVQALIQCGEFFQIPILIGCQTILFQNIQNCLKRRINDDDALNAVAIVFYGREDESLRRYRIIALRWGVSGK